MTPERMLWQSVLLKAVADATSQERLSREDSNAKKSADSWIRGGGRDFRMVCDLAGVDPRFVRDAYISGSIDGRLLRCSQERRA